MNVSKSTIGRSLCEKGTPKQLKKRGRPKIELNVMSLFPKYQFSSLKTIISVENLQLSVTTLSRRLRELNITKKKVYHCIGNNFELLNQKRTLFSRNMQHAVASEYISIDESSFYHRLNPLKAWSIVGERVHLPNQRIVSKRYTLLSAITSEGLLMQKVIVGSAKAVDFAAFILDFPVTQCTKVLLDNASIHKSKVVKEAFDRMGLSQVFTAPYSPEWNPVELYFSEIKRQYR